MRAPQGQMAIERDLLDRVFQQAEYLAQRLQAIESANGMRCQPPRCGIDVGGLPSHPVSDDRNSPDHHAGGFDLTEGSRQIT